MSQQETERNFEYVSEITRRTSDDKRKVTHEEVNNG
jgi:hypothetical protein